MSLFTDIRDQVYSLTNRPDLVSETELAVKAATLKGHQSDYYYKDLLETGISFLTSDYFQSLDVKTLLPRYRALKYARKYDASTTPGVPGRFFDTVPPEMTLDSYNQNRTNIVYGAGELLQFRSDTQFQYILFGCYLNPSLVEATYTSWIANDHPYYIVYEAARTVFKTIAYDEQAAAYEKLISEQLTEVKMSNILVNGI